MPRSVPRLRVGIALEASLWGGLESHTVEVVQALHERGHEPVLLCSGRQTAALMEPRVSHLAEVRVLPRFGTELRETVTTLRALALDACIYQKGTLHAGGIAFDAALRFGCGPYVAIQHAAAPPLPPPSARRWFGIRSPSLWRHKMIWRGRIRSVLPTLTVCVSADMAEALRRDYRMPADKLVVITNGVDVDRFRDDAAARVRIRGEWRVPATAFVLGAVCRLVPEKGLDVCVEALRHATDASRLDIRLVIVGEGPERHRLEAASAARGLGNAVHFAGFREDVASVLAAFDVFVLPSRFEGLPITVLEALAVGRPVIATTVGGTPEIMGRADVGWLVPPNDAAALAAAVLSAAQLPAGQLQAMGAAAREHVSTRFSAAATYRAIVDLVEARRSSL